MMMRKTTILFIVALCCITFSCSDAQQRIINGVEVGDEFFQFIASIRNDQHLCAGTLISPTFVLTVAHCTPAMEGGHVVVGASTLDEDLVNTNGVKRQIKNIFVHPKYYNLKYDFALIELDQPITSLTPIRLNLRFDEEEYKLRETPGRIGMILGWGVTNHEKLGGLSNVLRRASIEILPDDICWWKMVMTYHAPAMMCLGDTEKEDQTFSCKGDSGGPFIVKHRQVGVMSFGAPSCNHNSIFARVSSATEWILEVVHDLDKSSTATVPPTHGWTAYPTPKPTSEGHSNGSLSPTQNPTVFTCEAVNSYKIRRRKKKTMCKKSGSCEWRRKKCISTPSPTRQPTIPSDFCDDVPKRKCKRHRAVKKHCYWDGYECERRKDD